MMNGAYFNNLVDSIVHALDLVDPPNTELGFIEFPSILFHLSMISLFSRRLLYLMNKSPAVLDANNFNQYSCNICYEAYHQP